MILRDIVKIENEKPEREEKGMGEVKQTNFRVDKETADKFRQFCMDAGMNQAQGFDHVIYLCGKNRTAERINDVRIAKLKGKERVYDISVLPRETLLTYRKIWSKKVWRGITKNKED